MNTFSPGTPMSALPSFITNGSFMTHPQALSSALAFIHENLSSSTEGRAARCAENTSPIPATREPSGQVQTSPSGCRIPPAHVLPVTEDDNTVMIHVLRDFKEVEAYVEITGFGEAELADRNTGSPYVPPEIYLGIATDKWGRELVLSLEEQEEAREAFRVVSEQRAERYES